MKSVTNKITSSIISTCIPDHLFKPFPANNMQMMTVSGAKGSNVNVSQISCLLGQQELEGRRVPVMVSGKTLPSFRRFDQGARAGGYITGRFLTGVRPQEYFFHCMAGREGLIDTAVKTSRSGYLQRCLIKHLEGLRVHYDHTVRDVDGSVVQFHYGEDSLDVVKQKVLTKFDFCAQNYEALVGRYFGQGVAEGVEEGGVRKRMRRVGKLVKEAEERNERLRGMEERGESEDAREEVVREFVESCERQGVRAVVRGTREVKTLEVGGEERVRAARFAPGRYLGSVSERFVEELDEYTKQNPSDIISTPSTTSSDFKKKHAGDLIKEKDFKALMEMKYMQSLVEPGEAVGLLAAQSIGEPSTQMTLNTFHFAGFGAKNVTLGIPRLREIIMTASGSIKTPMMRLPLLPAAQTRQNTLCKQISRLTLSQIMEGVTVREKLIFADGARKKELVLRLKFWRKKDVEREHNVSVEDLEWVIEKRFVSALEKAITREIRGRVRKGEMDEVGVALGNFERVGEGVAEEGGEGEESGAGKEEKPSRKGKGPAKKPREVAEDVNDDDDDVLGSEDEGDDGDATAEKKAGNRTQRVGYDAADEEDEEVLKGAERKEEDGEEEGAAGEGDSGKDSDGRTREERIQEGSKYCVGYDFDRRAGRWCELKLQFAADTKKLLMVAIIEDVCRDVVLHEVKGISRCYPLPNESENDTSVNIGTDGVNLRGMWDYASLIDVNNIYTNDIAAILRTYGVEAARAGIMQEIAGVFGVYGINVDTRHLSLIADYMTFEGGYKPFNRMGMGSNPSPFAQMSFETTTGFLTNATLNGDFDPLESPSARIVLGKPVKGGTGSFEVFQKIDRKLRPRRRGVNAIGANDIMRQEVVEAY
ncbi:hypothetical protein HK097_002758 [Rhizophlyctis rosea]|uniref:DNA-directed RNA polymerase I subunit RPA1 n=1 Tax=Rhizophlyctis rosea TaxID=64517 RepID=A0AAD5S4W4_9FUNG|nr:hypothetical protein HK097_002758 [Rhizophlyctis rosea]